MRVRCSIHPENPSLCSHVSTAFYRQSLQHQYLTAQLFHNATALRGIEVPEDVQKMLPGQRDLAIKSIQIGHQILDITVNSQAYMEGMKYGESLLDAVLSIVKLNMT